MRVKVQRAPDSVWFGYMKMKWSLASDFGRYIFWICGWQIAVFIKAPNFVHYSMPEVPRAYCGKIAWLTRSKKQVNCEECLSAIERGVR